MRTLVAAAVVLAAAGIQADEITMKNGQKVSGSIEELKDGQLSFGVFAGYLGGYPATQTQKVRFSNVRSIAFDGRDDYFSIVRKNNELTFGYIRELSRGKFTVDGSDPITASSVKALVRSKPNAEENK